MNPSRVGAETSTNNSWCSHLRKDWSEQRGVVSPSKFNFCCPATLLSLKKAKCFGDGFHGTGHQGATVIWVQWCALWKDFFCLSLLGCQNDNCVETVWTNEVRADGLLDFPFVDDVPPGAFLVLLCAPIQVQFPRGLPDPILPQHWAAKVLRLTAAFLPLHCHQKVLQWLCCHEKSSTNSTFQNQVRYRSMVACFLNGHY